MLAVCAGFSYVVPAFDVLSLRAPVEQVLRRHVRRRRQRLRRSQDGTRRYLFVGGRGLGRVAVHIERPEYQLCLEPHQVVTDHLD